MTAEYIVHGDVAVITLTNPPVNGLGLSTRVAITDGLHKANQDPAVKAIVITGAARPFQVALTSASLALPRHCRNRICSA